MWHQHPCSPGEDCGNEIVADIFLGWTYNRWGSDNLGIGESRRIFMDTNMAEWIH